MGSGLTEEEKQPQTSATPYGDIFDEFLPHYLAMGMPYDLFWDGEYGTKTAWVKAYKLRLDNEQRFSDWQCWQMGQYLISALRATAIVVNGFAPKGVQLSAYPDKPFIEQEEAKKKEEKAEELRKKQEDQSKVAMAMFQAMISKFNKNVEKRLEREKQNGSGQ